MPPKRSAAAGAGLPTTAHESTCEMIIARPSPDRIERLEQLLRIFTACYGSEASLTRQVAQNLAHTRTARDGAQDAPDMPDTREGAK